VATALTLLALGDDSGAEFLLDPTVEEKEWALFAWFGPTVLRLPDRPAAARRVKARMTVANLLPPDKTDPGQVVIVSDSLGLLATPEARRALARLLSHQSRYVRGRAAMNLMACSSSAADVASVKRLAEGDAALFARVKAAQALAMKGHPAYAEPIRAAVTAAGVDDFDRAAALESLGLLRRAEDAPLAAAQLQAADPYVRLCAAEALERIGTTEALAAVAAARSDTNLRVRMAVEKCLAAHAA
jgi:HEAT repeat protein